MIKIRSVGGKFSKDFLVLSGYLFAFSSSLVLLITFLNAYFHGMKTLILIDSYGEATFELFLILPVFGVIVLGLSIYLVGFWRSHAKKTD